MKIEIILPDGAIAGTMTYMSIEDDQPYLNNVCLNGLEDGNRYDCTVERLTDEPKCDKVE